MSDRGENWKGFKQFQEVGQVEGFIAASPFGTNFAASVVYAKDYDEFRINLTFDRILSKQQLKDIRGYYYVIRKRDDTSKICPFFNK